MSDLTDFLLQRIAEDEAVARAVVESHDMYDWDSYVSSAGMYLEPANRFAVANDPARVLRECEAKRWIVELHQVRAPKVARAICNTCWGEPFAGHLDFPCPTLRHTAAVYSDHPDYDPSWRSDA